MKIKFQSKGTTLIASPMGELDHHSAEYVREKIDGQIIKSSTKNVIFDFSDLNFMDSSGIGVIIGRYKNLKQLGGKTAIANLNEHIKKIFELSGLLKIIPVYDNIESAINNM